MAQSLSRDISDFTRRDFTFDKKTKPVLVTGERGPAVVVIHEVFGFTPTLARFCRWLRDADLRVYAPILFGSPDARNAEKMTAGRIAGLCVSREFTLFKEGASSPVVEWLKPLARQAHEECGGPGVGVIGLCLTGGFALSMAVDPVVLAPILAEPGAPATKPAALDISKADLNKVKARTKADGLTVRGYRFQGDKVCKPERFQTLRRELGHAFAGVELPDGTANPAGRKPPHSVFTGDLIDAAGQPTREAVDEVIAYLHGCLAA